MKTKLTLLIALFFNLTSFAQSLNGNFSSAESESALSYGNVDVYREGKLVASVITDRMGNFHIPLDSGKYTCVVNYSGYKPITKEIIVKDDEVSNFKAETDKSKKQYAPKVLETKAPVSDGLGVVTITSGATKTLSRDTEDRTKGDWSGSGEGFGSGSLTHGIMEEPPVAQKTMAKSGSLTAGEINDFSKWKLWQDIANAELSTYQSSWNIAPKGRYTLMLQSTTGLPLADAKVTLMEGRTTRFVARTDNTGKAECWLTIKNETPEVKGALSFKVEYKDQVKTIEKVTAFEESMNHLALQVQCEQTEVVDIAFVVDATGSMGDELNYLKAEMTDIAYKSKQISNSLNFRFANVFYRDKGINELYHTRKMDFNRVLTESVAYIDEQYAGGGGDYEEAVEDALDTAINALSWSMEARTRILFLILDAPPHNNPEIQAKLQRLIGQAAEKGIRIVPIGASGINKSTEYLMRTLALGTNGTYTFLTNHSGIGGYHIEPTTDKYDVETLNELIVRVLKSYTYMPDCEQQLPDVGTDIPDSIVEVPDSNALVTKDSISVRDSLGNTLPDPVHITWSYYPNPTNGIVNIVSDADIEELYITDFSGKVLQIIGKIEANRTIQVDLSQYATGIYLIRYPQGEKWISGKVILQRTS